MKGYRRTPIFIPNKPRDILRLLVLCAILLILYFIMTNKNTGPRSMLHPVPGDFGIPVKTIFHTVEAGL